jgi:guanylate kinase
LKRLRDRKREDENGIQKRFNAARTEMEAARGSSVYNLFITNGTIEESIAQAVGAVNGERARRRAARGHA